MSVFTSCLTGVCELLHHNKRLLMTQELWDSAEENHYAHKWSHKTRKHPGDEERERRCQQTDWKCSYKQQMSLSNMTAFPLTSFLALGRSMRIFKARRSWVDFFTQTLNREKRCEKDTVNPTACLALEQKLADAWCLPCFYQTIKQLWIKKNKSNLVCSKHAFCSLLRYRYAEGVKAESCIKNPQHKKLQLLTLNTRP